MLFTFGATALAISAAKCPGFVKQKRTGHNTRLLYLRHLRIFVAALAVAMFVAGCGTPDGSANSGEPQKSETSREEVSVGDTEAIVWGEGDRGVVLSHGASYDAASWEPRIEYLKEEHNVQSMAFIGASEGEGIAEQVRRMTKEAPGDLNEALILPGDAHSQALFQTEGGERLMRAILERLEEYG